NIEGEMLHGPKKAEAATELAERLGAKLKDCYAYSDSAADIPLLELVGHPSAVNPDAELLAHAEQRHWPIIWPEETKKNKRRRS
ncbi:MAG: HAD hydrolase family protein, partial [Microbacteriaceae bacterium]|nr:HAD hydrolase family protein [Microbacteriaceae bacterium]